MAGSCKPNVVGLGKEAKYKVIDWMDYYKKKKNPSTTICGLFDENNSRLFDSANSFTWWYPYNHQGDDNGYFLEIEIYEDCNIWKYYCKYEGDLNALNGKLKVEKYNNGNYIDVTDKINQLDETNPNQNICRKIFEKIPKGRYRFSTIESNTRTDTEWYLESLVPPTKYLIKSNNRYYSLKEGTYDKANKQYNSISIDNIDGNFLKDNCIDDLSVLTTEIIIDSETFKPINKFKEFQIITIDDGDGSPKLNINGLKTDKQLIVANNDILKKIVKNIDWFELKTNVSDNGKVKIVFSNDKGVSWYTYENDKFVKLDECVIPIKEYEKLSEDEKKRWNGAIKSISEKGIECTNLKNIDFNKFSGDTMRFAYVVETPSYNSVSEVDKLSWQFDAKGSMTKMKDNEYDTELLENSIKFTPKIDNELIKINVLTNGDKEDSKTEEKPKETGWMKFEI